MPQLLALEWNSREARVVLASAPGGEAVIEQAFAVPLAGQPSAAENPEADLGGRIAAALAAKGIGRADVLVALGRGGIEIRQLRLPAVPDEELPEIVRFQAVREFSDMDDQWLLDFEPIDGTPDGPRTVLVAAVAPERAGHIRGVCHSAGLKVRRLVPRAHAAAALAARAGAAPSNPLRLLVDLSDDEADLTATVDGKVVLLRATRLGGAAPHAAALVSELRRTMAAVAHELGGRKVEAIVLCGGGDAHAALARQLQQELETPVELFDPFAGLKLGGALAAGLPEHPGRFAPLLGLVLAELQQRGHALDFLHPRRPAAPPNPRRKYLLAAAAALVAAVAWLVYARIDSRLLAREVNALQAQSQALNQEVAQADKLRALAADISQWADADAVWLEHLRGLSRAFPPSERAIVRQATFSPAAGGGEIRLRGFADKSATIAALEDALRRHARRVVAHESHADHSQRGYGWLFVTSVFVARESP